MSDVEPLPGPRGEGWTPPGVEQPQGIRTAVRLMYVGAGLAVLFILLTVFQQDAIRDAIEDADDGTSTASEIDRAVDIFVISTVVVGLIIIGLWIWMAMTNGQGKAWARTVATVLGALNVLFTLFGLAGPQTALGIVLSVVEVVLAATILWLLYRPESNRFYDAQLPR